MRFHLGRLSQLSKAAAAIQALTLLYLLYDLTAALFFAPAAPAKPPPGAVDPGIQLEGATRMFTILWTVPGIILCTGVGLLNWFAADNYLQGTRYGLLKLTAFLNLVPCLSACVFGWILGIYELWVLYSDDVKRVFEAVERGKPFASAMQDGGPGGSGMRSGLRGATSDLDGLADLDAPPSTEELLADEAVRVNLDDVEGTAAKARARQAAIERQRKVGGLKTPGTSGSTPAPSSNAAPASGTPANKNIVKAASPKASASKSAAPKSGGGPKIPGSSGPKKSGSV